MKDIDARRRERYQQHVLPEVEVLLRVALSMTGQPADAEDLVQDTLLRAWRSMDSFDGRHPRAWLLTILRNAHINRHRRRRPVLLDDPDVTFEQHAATDGGAASAEDVVVDGMTRLSSRPSRSSRSGSGSRCCWWTCTA